MKNSTFDNNQLEDDKSSLIVDTEDDKYSLIVEADYVKICYHSDGKLVTKKVLIKEGHEGTLTSVLREVTIIRSLKHKNVITCLNVDMNDLNVNITMPCMKYTMHDIIKCRRNFDGKEITRYIFELVKGVCYLHSRGVIHRDLKPKNILISAIGEVKIADFGLSRDFVDTYTDAKMTTGLCTIWYRPPEFFSLQDEYDVSSDMWSLGCIIYEIITGFPLFPGNSSLEVCQKIEAVMYPRSVVGYMVERKIQTLYVEDKELLDSIHLWRTLVSRLVVLKSKSRWSARTVYFHKVFDNIRGDFIEETCSTEQTLLSLIRPATEICLALTDYYSLLYRCLSLDSNIRTSCLALEIYNRVSKLKDYDLAVFVAYMYNQGLSEVLDEHCKTYNKDFDSLLKRIRCILEEFDYSLAVTTPADLLLIHSAQYSKYVQELSKSLLYYVILAGGYESINFADIAHVTIYIACTFCGEWCREDVDPLLALMCIYKIQELVKDEKLSWLYNYFENMTRISIDILTNSVENLLVKKCPRL